MDRKEYRRAYYLVHREKLIAQTRAHQLAHAEERKEYMRKYAEEHKETIAPYKKEKSKQSWSFLKEKLLSEFGTKCANCGFENPLALQIDPIFGGGSKHRRLVTGSKYYEEILGDPDRHNKYQVLCANCNFIKRAGEMQ